MGQVALLEMKVFNANVTKYGKVIAKSYVINEGEKKEIIINVYKK